MWRSITSNLYKSRKNYFLLLSAIMLLFSLLQPVFADLIWDQFDNALEVFDRTSSIGAMREMECVAYALIASQAYLVEKKTGYLKFAIQREGRRKYLLGCLVSTGIYSAFSIIFSFSMFIIVLVWRGYPLYPTGIEKMNELCVSGSQVLLSRSPWRVWIIIGACLLISSIAWTLSALAVSACTDNLFFVVLSPMLLSFLMHSIMSIIDRANHNYLLYNGIDFYYLGRGITNITEPWIAIRTTLTWYIPIIIFAGVIFWVVARRKMNYE